jgi:hypothetical protein
LPYPRVVVEDLGSVALCLEDGFRSRGRNWRGADEGSGLKFPVKEAVRARMKLLVALDAIEVEAHADDCLE